MAYPGDIGDKYQIGTVQAGKMPSAESDATFVIDLSTLVKAGNDIFDTITTGGGAIRVTTGDGATQIARCILDIDLTAKTGIVAINSPSIDVAETVRVYYNATATEPASDSTYGSENAWDTTYDGAYFESNKSEPNLKAGSTLADATSNANDLDFFGTDFYTMIYDSKQTGGAPGHQCCFYDGSDYYFIDTNHLYKRSTFDSAIGQIENSDPVGDLNTAKTATTTHCGAGVVYNGYLYMPVENWTDCGSNSEQHIARYDITDLSYDNSWDISAQGHEASGLCIEPNDGTNGLIYVSDYCIHTSNFEVHTYDLVTPSTHIADIVLDVGIINCQGISVDANAEMVISNATDMYWYEKDGTLLGRRAKLDLGGMAGGQSNFWSGEDLFWWDGANDDLFKFIPVVDSAPIGDYIMIGNTATNYAGATYTLPDVGTVQYIFKPRVAYYNYNAVFDNSAGANFWEGWIYSDGRMANRISSLGTRIYDLDNLHTPSGEEYVYYGAFGWTKTTTADTAVIMDGESRDSGTQTWVAPGTDFFWNGEGGGNNAGSCVFYYMAFRNIDLAKDVDRTLSEYNNQSAPDTFWAFGDEQIIPEPVEFNAAWAMQCNNLLSGGMLNV